MERVVIRKTTGDALLVLLPVEPVGADSTAHWWRLADGALVESGNDASWIEGSGSVIGLAPTSRLRLEFPESDETGDQRQRMTVARLAALEEGLSEGGTAHAVAAMAPSQDDRLVVAVAANDVMIGWIDWAERHGIDLGPIVPAAMAVPLTGRWTRAVIGNDRIVAGHGTVLPDEPGLTDALVDGEVALVDDDALGAGLAAIAADPVPNLRIGPFARRRVIIDRARWGLIAALVAAIILVTTLTAIVQIVKMNRATAALDAETLAIAQKIGGANVTIDTAEGIVAARAGGSGGLSGPVANLLARLQQEQNVTVTTLGYAPGQVTTTLAAPGAVDANRLIAALQRDGYRVTAVPRQSSDGRTMFDVTIRDAM